MDHSASRALLPARDVSAPTDRNLGVRIEKFQRSVPKAEETGDIRVTKEDDVDAPDICR